MLDNPKIRNTLKILEPTTFPRAMSLSPFLAATIEVTNSGREVPTATMVRPIRASLRPVSYTHLMQEFRRDVEMAEKTSLPELEEEVAANVVKSKFLLAVEKKDEEEEGKNVQVPYVKNQNGDVFQPVFTDAEEFRRFNKEGKFQALLVNFENMEKVLIPVSYTHLDVYKRQILALRKARK